jgi:hypothetical protein
MKNLASLAMDDSLRLRIAIAIATADRREVLSETVTWLHGQTRPADGFYICPACDDDLDPACLADFPSPTHVVAGERGLPAQRNAILRQLQDYDLVIFFDDDFLPEPKYLEELEKLFVCNPTVVVATGHVLADGACGIGISAAEAIGILQNLPPRPKEAVETSYGGYGCNMAIRLGIARAAQVEFDENLPLYAWWEDVDFARRMAFYGRVVRNGRMRGVHLGTKKGRTPGKRLGYSQVANILYMVRKGSIPLSVAVPRIAKNVLANLVRSVWPEPWVDRRGRLLGNLIALKDAAKGKIDPREILKL